jgi:diguanylate cyclase (GGDEF)-like protein
MFAWSVCLFIQSRRRNTTKGSKLRAAILIVDADYLKKMNDNFGHPVGDKIKK